MLCNVKKIKAEPEAVAVLGKPNPRFADITCDSEFINAGESLTKQIGQLIPGKAKHFYSWGNFNSLRLIFYLLKQTGPASIIMCTYSISPRSIDGLIRRKTDGTLKDVRFLVDNRVRSISPKPFALLAANFDYRCISVHAKVTCIYNDDWKITVITSQNATDNPKLERGIIFTDAETFEFDYNILENEFQQGST